MQTPTAYRRTIQAIGSCKSRGNISSRYRWMIWDNKFLTFKFCGLSITSWSGFYISRPKVKTQKTRISYRDSAVAGQFYRSLFLWNSVEQGVSTTPGHHKVA